MKERETKRFRECLKNDPRIKKDLKMRYDIARNFINFMQLKRYEGNLDDEFLLIYASISTINLLLDNQELISDYASSIGINKIVLAKSVGKIFHTSIDIQKQEKQEELATLLITHSLLDRLTKIAQTNEKLAALTSFQLTISTLSIMIESGRIKAKDGYKIPANNEKTTLFIFGNLSNLLNSSLYDELKSLSSLFREYDVKLVCLVAGDLVVERIETNPIFDKEQPQFNAIRKLWGLEQDNIFLDGIRNTDIFVATVEEAIKSEVILGLEVLSNAKGLFINCPTLQLMKRLWTHASYITFECKKLGLPTQLYFLVNSHYAGQIPQYYPVESSHSIRRANKDPLLEISQLKSSLLSYVDKHLFISCQDTNFRGLNDNYSEILQEVVRLKTYQIDSLTIASHNQIKHYSIRENLPIMSQQNIIITPTLATMQDNENQPIISHEICNQRAAKWQVYLSAFADARSVAYLLDAEKLVYLAVQTPITARLNKDVNTLLGNSLDINDSEISYHRKHYCRQAIKSYQLEQYTYEYSWQENNVDLNYTSKIIPVSADELILVVSDSIGQEWQTQYFLRYQASKNSKA